MTTAIRLYRTYILSTFVPLNTIRRVFGFLFFAVVNGLPASRLASAFASSAGAVPKALCMRRFALYRFACGDPVLIYNI